MQCRKFKDCSLLPSLPFWVALSRAFDQLLSFFRDRDFTHTHTHLYTRTHLYTYTHVHICIHTHIHINTKKHKITYKLIHTNLNKLNLDLHIYKYTQKHIDTNTYRHTFKFVDIWLVTVCVVILKNQCLNKTMWIWFEEWLILCYEIVKKSLFMWK